MLWQPQPVEDGSCRPYSYTYSCGGTGVPPGTFSPRPCMPLLVCNLDEVTETVQVYKHQTKPHFTLSETAVKALFDMSQSHAGLVTSALDVLYAAHKAKRRETAPSEQRVTSEITLQNFLEYTSDISTLLTKLYHSVSHRSFLKVTWVTRGFVAMSSCKSWCMALCYMMLRTRPTASYIHQGSVKGSLSGRPSTEIAPINSWTSSILI